MQSDMLFKKNKPSFLLLHNRMMMFFLGQMGFEISSIQIRINKVYL